MKSKKLNIILLVFFQLAVFTSPFLVKSFHHHVPGHILHTNSKTSFNISEKTCLICQYEFVTFELTKPVNFSFGLPSAPLKNSEVFKQAYYTSFSYYSHRAPPIS